MKQRMNKWLVVGIAGIVLAVPSMLIGGMFSGYEASDLIIRGIAGLLLGAIAAPTIEPEAFRTPALWQISFGVLGGVLFMAAGSTVPAELLAGGAVGGVLGFFAPYWVKYIPTL